MPRRREVLDAAADQKISRVPENLRHSTIHLSDDTVPRQDTDRVIRVFGEGPIAKLAGAQVRKCLRQPHGLAHLGAEHPRKCQRILVRDIGIAGTQ